MGAVSSTFTWCFTGVIASTVLFDHRRRPREIDERARLGVGVGDAAAHQHEMHRQLRHVHAGDVELQIAGAVRNRDPAIVVLAVGMLDDGERRAPSR